LHAYDSVYVIYPQGPATATNNINKCEKWSHKTTTTTPAVAALKNLLSSPSQ